MARWARVGLLVGIVAGGLAIAPLAAAHDCADSTKAKKSECQPTPAYGGWRPNWVPLFDVPDRQDDVDGYQDGERPTDESTRTHQRWRDEYGCQDQMCIWADPNLSTPPVDGSEDDGSPRSLHTGIAADHSFGEGFHESEDHVPEEEGTHDGHGGTIYADVCLAEDTHYTGDKADTGCADANDSEVGVVVTDHLDCTFGCQDEYHIVRPTDPEYTQRQMEESQKDAQYDAEHPDDWLCGYDGYGANCPLPDSE